MTPNLKLKLTTDAGLNDDLYKLDDAIGVLNRWTGGTGATPGPPIAPVATPTAPFPCVTGTGGLYTDTDCQKLCLCAGTGTAGTWCRTDTGVCGTATDCCAGTTTTTTTSTTTTTLLLPVHVDSDANCPATLPTTSSSQSAAQNQVRASETCTTGAAPFGYQVNTISTCINGGTAGTAVICSVYTRPSGTFTKVSPGCDTAQLTIPASPSGYYAVATTGSCTLAPSTRYWIACNTNANDLAYCSATGSNTGDTIWTTATFPTLPATWTAAFNTTSYLNFYLLATPLATAPTTTTTTTTTTTSTTSTTLIVPAAMGSDANCPATLPGGSSSTSSVGILSAAITCPTQSAGRVVSISFFATTGTAGAHQKCSVYTFPAGYVAGTTSIPKVAAGCDTIEWTAPSGTTNGWVTLTTTGTCTLAAATRYQIACNQDAAYFIGYNTGCTIGGVQCNQERTVTYATGALPDPWTANNQGATTAQYYLTLTGP